MNRVRGGPPPQPTAAGTRSAASGRRRRSSAPPPARPSACTVPPCASATRRTIASPSPEPGSSRAVAERKKRSKTCGRSLGVDPGAAVGDRDLAFGRDADLDLAARGAPLDRVVEQVGDGPLERALDPVHRDGVAVSSIRTVVVRVRARSTAASTRRSRRSGAAASSLELGVAGEVDQIADQHRQLLELRDHVGEHPFGAASGISFEWARTSMFVRRLASGVRSSCEASATSWRWESIELSSAFSIVLKLPASARARRCRSVSIRRLRSRVAATSLGGAAEAVDRRQRRPRDEYAEARPRGRARRG